MAEFGILDTHTHIDPIGKLYAWKVTADDMLELMDRLDVEAAVCIDHGSLYDPASQDFRYQRKIFKKYPGRLYFLGVFDPRSGKECLKIFEEHAGWEGFKGIKIHPSFHNVSADDPGYDEVWSFARSQGLPIMTHSWSTSPHNPAQRHSTPEKFEQYISAYPEVPIILAHAGGRGEGRKEVCRLAAAYPQVHTDIAGDIYDLRLLESLIESVPPEKVLYGSDFPWLDPRSNLTRVLMADIPASVKEQILRENARRIYDL